uniref:hypothetical protein n=1 Tax=Amycolatopsis sp. CA-096443 TaxID=3239919 RepID=UPI003F499319
MLIRLPGIRPGDVQSHLAGIGLLRVLGEQRPEWNPFLRVSASLDAAVSVDVDALQFSQWLLDSYHPTPTISPWNAGSGLGLGYLPTGGQKTSATTVPALDELANRNADWHVTLIRARRLVDAACADRWPKQTLVRQARNSYPDIAVPWVDACWTPRGYDTGQPITVNPALGTGGNIGRADLGAIMARRVLDIQTDARSERWLIDALLGTHDTPLVEDTEGHLGAIGLVNPWRWVLAMEGLIGLCSIPTYGLRHPADARAVPVVIPEATPTGTATAGEATHELWLPLWDEGLSWPLLMSTVADTGYLGAVRPRRAHSGAARTGLTAAMSTASRLPDPLTATARYVCAVRHGRSPIYLSGEIITTGREETRLVTPTELAERWGVTPSRVRHILRRVKAVDRDPTTGANRYALAEAQRARETQPGQGVRSDLHRGEKQE